MIEAHHRQLYLLGALARLLRCPDLTVPDPSEPNVLITLVPEWMVKEIEEVITEEP